MMHNITCDGFASNTKNAPTAHAINAPTYGINAETAVKTPISNAYGILKMLNAIAINAPKIQASTHWPDKNFENEKKFRARQNVVLELGMLLSKLGRSRVAVVTKNVSNLEKPSDIQGIIYHSYNENISEISSRLIRELNAKGYNIVA